MPVYIGLNVGFPGIAGGFNGGQTWQQDPIPLTTCSGGLWPGTGDPWLSFAPNGDLYGVAAIWNSNSSIDLQIVVSKSADGGLHWSAPVVLPGSGILDPPADHPSITADPTNPQFVYAIWNGNNSKHGSAAVFARTTDGGATFTNLQVMRSTDQGQTWSGRSTLSR